MDGAEAERVLATNRAGWNHVAPMFHGRTALPEYGPLFHAKESRNVGWSSGNAPAKDGALQGKITASLSGAPLALNRCTESA